MSGGLRMPGPGESAFLAFDENTISEVLTFRGWDDLPEKPEELFAAFFEYVEAVEDAWIWEMYYGLHCTGMAG